MRRVESGYIAGTLGVLIAVLLLLPFREHLNSTPVALTFLLVILFTAARYGSAPALVVSIISVLCINFFFLPPYHTFVIADAGNWIALAAFLITSLIAGSLSVREKRRAEEAELRKREVEALYVQLREAFTKASEAEALKQSEQLKSALLDAVTHDLRTPLTSMKAAATTLLAAAQPLDEEGRREMLEVINSEIDRLNHLLENLIEMAKIEAGAMEPRKVWSNIEEIISIGLTRASEITSRHQLRLDLEPNLPPVRVDEKAVAEVLFVLIENAVKYSKPNSNIVVSVYQNGAATLKVSVEDAGVGIPSELREKVFDKFFRFVRSDPAQHYATGLGMGLAIARGLVEAHKGRIWIEDTSSGRGIRVCFTLPLQERELTAR